MLKLNLHPAAACLLLSIERGRSARSLTPDGVHTAMDSDTTLPLSRRIVDGYRLLFYMYTPSESTFSDVQGVPDYMLRSSPQVFSLLLLETLILHIKYWRNNKLKLPRWNNCLTSLSSGIVSQLPLLVIRNIEYSSYQWVHKNFCLYELPWDSAWTWILMVFGVDFGFYWFHRCAHEINIMWAGHQTHHGSEDYNLTTALRQGVFQIYSSWLFYLPLALFIPPPMFLVHLQLNILYQFWLHTQVIDKIGFLEYIMNTPSHHRVHHGINRYCIDKNFAGVFIIWDRMFGTFEAEQKSDEIAYGLVHQVDSWNPIYIQTNHLLHILKSLWNAENFKHRLSILFKGPGWQPGKPRLGNIEDIPDVRGPVKKYNKKASSPWLTFYCIVQFLVTIVFYESLFMRKKKMPVSLLFVGGLYVLWSFSNISFIFESRWFAKLSELARWTVFLLLHSYWWCVNGRSDELCPPPFTFAKYAAIASIASTTVWMIRDAFFLQKKAVHEE